MSVGGNTSCVSLMEIHFLLEPEFKLPKRVRDFEVNSTFLPSSPPPLVALAPSRLGKGTYFFFPATLSC